MLLVNKEQGIRTKTMIKELLKKLILGKRYSSEIYINYLRSIGVKIGEDCTIYVPSKTLIDEQYPWMITIGDHVRITEGCKLLTHDYSWSVLKLYASGKENSGGIYGASGEVKIGDNVFIGMNTIVCRGVTIGNNVIIGAGSVVTTDCEANGVYAGVPAKRIAEVNDFLEKRKRKQLEEAKVLAVRYYQRYGKKAPVEVFHEYFMLFTQNDDILPEFDNKMRLCGNYDESRKYLRNHEPHFKSFEEFLEYCYEE